MLGIAGYAVSFIIYGLAHVLWLLFIARIAGGVLSAAVMPTAMAYIGDITTEEQRGSGKMCIRDSNMTPHKVPVYVEFRDELPKSGVKTLRRLLRDEEQAR